MITKFKIFEAGEWSRGIDWDYVKENPDDESDEASWIKYLAEKIKIVKEIVEKEEIEFEILDIRGFDMYQGPYATVRIDSEYTYKIWSYEDGLTIPDFPYNGGNEGISGDEYDIAQEIIEEYKPIKKAIRKYKL